MRWIAACLAVLSALCPATGLAQGLRPVTPNVFDVTDGNHDGKITREEFGARMHEVVFFLDKNKDGSLTRDEVPRASEAAFRAADKNGDGKLSMDEYIAARMQDFEAADRNKDGILTRGEAQ
jgi:hypothetical protein